MAKKSSARRRAPDMSKYVSPRMQKGVHYLVGDHKVSFIARARAALKKARVRLPA